MKHVMIDLETLATTADAVIMSIGAVRFDLDSTKLGEDGFYASVSIESNLEKRRRIDEDTLVWWMKQDAAAQHVFHEPKQALGDALESLSVWVGDDDSFVWSNGADFDLPMLAHAYRSFDWLPPWKFWNSRCFRTFKGLSCAGQAMKIPGNKAKHNALADAVYQARCAQAIQAVLTGKPKATS